MYLMFATRESCTRNTFILQSSKVLDDLCTLLIVGPLPLLAVTMVTKGRRGGCIRI
jgi:hypothetical protein